ncbi:MAG: CpsD/CapB family tyrosine-protein kinase [Steroidobacteraceae bacterium]
MSIVDAIQRAKQISHDKSAAAPMLDAQVAETVTRNAATTRLTSAGQPAAAMRVKFDAVPYDAAVCTQRHVILPGVDDRMLQAGAPSYRMMRTRILQRCRTNGWSTLAITSPGPGEGKSVTALNLAINLAREGNYEVFLLDLDLRNPSICRYLGVTPKQEITGFFRGELSAESMFFSLDGINNLSLAGGAQATSHASELLATGHLEDLFAYIRSISGNPLILIDLPPVVNTDDALIVAPRVDATLLVVSEGSTTREGLERAAGLLADYRVAGIVLNQSSESIGSGYYGA